MKVVIGIDEVGRGPLAGPVAVCAFRGQIHLSKIKKTGLPIRDSKKLTRTQREVWFSHLKEWQENGECDFSVTMVSAKMIDRIGLTRAIQTALARSLFSVTSNFKSLILLDGGLKAPAEFPNQKTIIKGDEKEKLISFASIVAKVTRDRYMMRQAKKFPEYGFESHVGYGTKKHYEAIKTHGLTKIHRRSFLKNI